LRGQEYLYLDVVVVDNASQDNTISLVSAEYPEVHLISTSENLGYSGGNNTGIQASLEGEADVLFLVNNDTILNPTCISRLVETVDRVPKVGVIGPMVYTWNNWHVISSAGGEIDWIHANAVNVGAGEMDSGQYKFRKVDFINGCGIMVTRAAVDQAGVLDSRYFMYWEETDWCQRILRAGFELYFQPAAKMQHKATIHPKDLGPATIYYMTRNRL